MFLDSIPKQGDHKVILSYFYFLTNISSNFFDIIKSFIISRLTFINFTTIFLVYEVILLTKYFYTIKVV